MLKALRFRDYALALLVLFVSLISPSGCRTKQTALKNLNPKEVKWAVHTSTKLKYSITYPTVLRSEEEESGEVLFRHGWGVPVLVRYENEKEGRRRGVWFGHEPVGSIELGGRNGEKYIYEHWDGPFAARTVSYVVEYRGKYLALEFRSDDELSEIQKRMLESFTFLPE